MSDKVPARRPGGFPEMLPKEQVVFNQMLGKTRRVFELCGFLPIETPAVESRDVLLAKGGGETEKQVYQLSKIGGKLTDLCLHFDLTVPLARYVVEHLDDIQLPFRRYQTQKVWRGERAQKGRYREFYQCDIDVIGTTNPLTDAEIPSVIYQVFTELAIPKFTIGVNNRKLVCGMYGSVGPEEHLGEFLTLADGIPKKGPEQLYTQMLKWGITTDNADFLVSMLQFRGSYAEMEKAFPNINGTNEAATEGLHALRVVYEGVLSLGVPSEFVNIDLGIVRGLDYYTGTVYETILDNHPQVGSICSGGRYDDLCGYYTDQNLPGVGISIGLSRLFFQLRDAGLLPAFPNFVSKALIVSPEQQQMAECFRVASLLRSQSINCEVYMETAKLSKQFKYANQLGIPFVVVIGEAELKNGKVSVKDMKTGDQKDVPIDELPLVLTLRVNKAADPEVKNETEVLPYTLGKLPNSQLS